MMGIFNRAATIVFASGALLLGGCELGHKESTQTGYRGTGLEQVVNVDRLAKAAAIPAEAYPLPARRRADRRRKLSERQGSGRGEQGTLRPSDGQHLAMDRAAGRGLHVLP